MKTRFAAFALLAAALLTPSAFADETTFCNAFITSLPVTIASQGHWCFDRNLSTAITTGAAITINVDFVVLDLNGFKIGGGSAGLATTAAGIFTSNHKNIVIRNGNIRGFLVGVDIAGTASKAVLVEDLRLDENTAFGIRLEGSNHVVRRNAISDTGGNTVGSDVSGISTATAVANLHIEDNSIVGVTQNSTATAAPDGIHVLGVAAAGSVMIIGNRIQNFVNRAIDAGESACRDNTVNPAAGTVFCTVVTGTFGR